MHLGVDSPVGHLFSPRTAQVFRVGGNVSALRIGSFGGGASPSDGPFLSGDHVGLIRTKDAAKILQRDRKTINRWIARGILTAYRPDGTKIFRLDEAEVRRLATELFEPTIQLPTETRKRRKMKIPNIESVPLGQNHGIGRFKHLYTKDQ